MGIAHRTPSAAPLAARRFEVDPRPVDRQRQGPRQPPSPAGRHLNGGSAAVAPGGVREPLEAVSRTPGVGEPAPSGLRARSPRRGSGYPPRASPRGRSRPDGPRKGAALVSDVHRPIPELVLAHDDVAVPVADPLGHPEVQVDGRGRDADGLVQVIDFLGAPPGLALGRTAAAVLSAMSCPWGHLWRCC